MADPKAFEREVEEFRGYQRDMQKLQDQRRQLVAQQGENEMVLDELKRLDASSQAEGGTKPRVFKLIGPALVAQDADEARATVSRRLAAIAQELERVAGLLGGLEAKVADKQRSLVALQQRMMAAQQQAQGGQQQQQQQQQQGGGQQAAAV